MRMTLPVVPQLQEDALWCWAAVSSMVATYYAEQLGLGVAYSQCEVASRTIAQPCCPSPPPPPACRIQQNLQKALVLVGHLNNRVEASRDFGVVAIEITARRPLCVAFQYNQGALHYLLVTGFDPVAQEIALVDPATGVLSTGPYSNLLQNNAGCWAGWVFTQ
jgi:hypothetical protein